MEGTALDGWTVYHKAVTESTNLDARAGKPGDVFTADEQTAGRGRLDHTWLSQPGKNLMMSVVLDVSRFPWWWDLPPPRPRVCSSCGRRGSSGRTTS